MNHGRRAEQFEAVLNVSRHVDSAWIVVAQVNDKGLLAGLLALHQTLGRSPHFALARVATAGEVGHVQFGANALDHAYQSILFYPALDVALLPVP